MYPEAVDKEKVGTYEAKAFAGGGYVWDEVLEYRVWCHSDEGDFYYAFDTCEKAIEFSNLTEEAEEPLALIRQKEYIDEPELGQYSHIKQERIVEWYFKFLSRPRRTDRTIPDFMSSDAPKNRLDIIRGIA